MDPAWIGIAGVVLGVVTTSVADVFKARSNFRRDKGWDFAIAQRGRLESLFETLEDAAESYGVSYAGALTVAATQKPSETLTPKKKIDWARLRMLTNLYFPEHKKSLDRVYRSGTALGATIAGVIMDSRPGSARTAQVIAKMDSAMSDFENAVDAMRGEIEQNSHRLARQATKGTDALSAGS